MKMPLPSEEQKKRGLNRVKVSISNLCKSIAEARADAKLWVDSEPLDCQTDRDVFWSVYRHISKAISAEKALRELIKNANEIGHDFAIGTLGSAMHDEPGLPIINVRESGENGELLDIIHIAISNRSYDANVLTKWDSECGSSSSKQKASA